MGKAIAAALALAALLSRRLLAKLEVAWQSPFGWLVPAAAAVVVWQAPQMPDMIAGLADGEGRRWPMVWFAVATVLLGWSGWHWMRAVIAARLGADNRDGWRRAGTESEKSRPGREAATTERAIETAPRAAITAAGLLAGATVLASYTSDARGFLLDAWDLAILGAAVALGRAAPWARRKLVEWPWFRTHVLERRWFGRPRAAAAPGSEARPSAADPAPWSRWLEFGGVPDASGVVLAKGVGGPRSLAYVLDALQALWLGRASAGAAADTDRAWPPADTFVQWWSELGSHFRAIMRAAPFGPAFAWLALLAAPAAMFAVERWPEWLPSAPAAALLALACLIPPLSLLHALLARLPVPAPDTMAFGLVLAMVFVVPWDPPSLYGARRMAAGSAAPGDRLELPRALEDWRGACLRGATPEAPRPVVIVAAEGGASRGALWLLSVMRHLDARTDGAFGRHVFAVAGVSGGSLGAATYLAAQRAAPGRDGCGVAWDRLAEGGRDPLDALGREDFLTPSVATYFLSDTLRRLLPVGLVLAPMRPDDRAVALERAFERYWDAALPGDAPRSLLGARPPTAPGAPHLLLNGTDAEAGRRLITATFRFGSDEADKADAVVRATGDVLFADADDLLGIIGRDVPLSTAVTNSARFPYINPAGRFMHAGMAGQDPEPESLLGRIWRPVAEGWAGVRRWFCRGSEWLSRSDWPGGCEAGVDLRQVVDGGYFENYGALTALELARKLRELGGGAIRPVVVVVSNDADRPADDPEPNIVACRDARPAPAPPRLAAARSQRQGDPAAYNEALAPLLGLYATRAAHGLAAVHALRRELCAKQGAGEATVPHGLIHVALPEPRRAPPPGEEEAAPMNWVLNAAARRLLLKTGLETPFNRAQTTLLCRTLGLAGCLGDPPPARVAAGGPAPVTPPKAE